MKLGRLARWPLFLFLTLLSGATVFMLSTTTTIYTESGERFVERTLQKDAPLVIGGASSPLGSFLMRTVDTEDGEGVAWTVRWVNATAILVIAGLFLLWLGPILTWWKAFMLASGISLMPSLTCHLYEIRPWGLEVFSIWAPGVILALSVSRHQRRGPLVAALGGILAGLAVFGTHLGIWTGLAALAAMLLSQAKWESGKGHLRLPAIGFEFLAAFGGFVVALMTVLVVGEIETKNLLNFWFDPFEGWHPPFAISGIVYSELGRGLPPAWVAPWRLLAQTPAPLLVLAVLGLASLRRFTRASIEVLPALAPAGALLLVMVLSGSGYYDVGVDGWALLAPLPVLLAVAGYHRWFSNENVPTGRGAAVLRGLVLVVAMGHLVWLNFNTFPHQNTYANLLAGGTGRFLASGNSVASEPRIEDDTLRFINGSGNVVFVPEQPGVADALRLAGRCDPAFDMKVRPMGPYPLVELYAPQSLGWRSWTKYLGAKEADVTKTIAGIAVWRVFLPRGGTE